MNRRELLKRTVITAGAAAIGFPTVLPSSVFGKNRPSNRIAIGCIGLGGMGMHNLKAFLSKPEAQVVALCDVDSSHLQSALNAAGLDASAGCRDYRRLLARPDIDAVVICTPDHWHVPIALDAVRAGKDLYCEKPLTLTIREGRELADAVRQCGRVCQTGSHQRSNAGFRTACELIRNGRLGRIERVRVEIPPNNRRCDDCWRPQPVPPELDYDMWLGPAPWAPYHEQRCHYTFRFISDYSGGQMTNWGTHHFDIVQWALGMDESGPVEIEGSGRFPESGLFDTADDVNLRYRYANGVEMRCVTGTGSGDVCFEGTEGVLWVSRSRLCTEPASIARSVIGPGETRLYRSDDHHDNFLDCVRTRRRPICDAETGHRSATVCHLGNIAMLTGERLTWDPQKEVFTNSDRANRLRSRAARTAWRQG